MRDPGRDCPLCPRLASFRRQARLLEPDWFNAPVPSFGCPESARLLIVGLAPGLRGANRTGRPFTGDTAGELLYATLIRHRFAKGVFAAQIGDGLTLVDCLIANAVRCVPPQNKPLPSEIKACRPFFDATVAAMPRLEAMVALGRVAHETVLRSSGIALAKAPFRHGAVHRLALRDGREIRLHDSYHCSRYNTNTGVLTPEMFDAVFAEVRARLA